MEITVWKGCALCSLYLLSHKLVKSPACFPVSQILQRTHSDADKVMFLNWESWCFISVRSLLFMFLYPQQFEYWKSFKCSCVGNLVTNLWRSWEIVDPLKLDPQWKKQIARDVPLEGLLGPTAARKLGDLLCHMLLPWYLTAPQAHRDRDPWDHLLKLLKAWAKVNFVWMGN